MHKRKLWTLAALSAGVMMTSRAASAAPALWARVVDPMTQVFPTAVPPGRPTAELSAARGEWEPFQIVVRADHGGPLANVRVEAAPLSGPSALPAPRLYRVEYLQITKPSSVEGKAGPWPDALVPAVDDYAHQARQAFPFTVPAGEARAIWVELFVPDGATPGHYRGAVHVSADGGASVDVPVALDVHRFTLPKTSSLPVTYGFTANAIGKAHPGLDEGALRTLTDEYEVAMLRHRISLHGGSMEPAPARVAPDGKVSIDWRGYDAEVGPFLDGKADAGGPADGARWTAVDLRVPRNVQGPARASYVQQLVAHFRSKGWLDRLFDYTWDEPGLDQLEQVAHKAEALRAATPDIPRLVTRVLDHRLEGRVDIWCPTVNYIDDKPGNSLSPSRQAYDERLKQGDKLWWYQACMSHGCNIYGGEYFTGWPSLAIDAPGMSHRILEWLTWRYKIGGELYYNTVEAYVRGLDPWKDQYLFGGNGDGTLFYPGRAKTWGGTRDFPVESVRLQLIREGLEDYEYLRLYARATSAAQADALAASLAGRTFEWSHDSARLYAARRKMAEAIDRAVAAGKLGAQGDGGNGAHASAAH